VLLGAQIATGLAGEDIFVFKFGSGHHTVTDFQPGEDLIDLTDFGIDVASLQAMIDATAPGADTVNLGLQDSITFAGVDVKQLVASQHFILNYPLAA